MNKIYHIFHKKKTTKKKIKEFRLIPSYISTLSWTYTWTYSTFKQCLPIFYFLPPSIWILSMWHFHLFAWCARHGPSYSLHGGTSAQCSQTPIRQHFFMPYFNLYLHRCFSKRSIQWKRLLRKLSREAELCKVVELLHTSQLLTYVISMRYHGEIILPGVLCAFNLGLDVAYMKSAPEPPPKCEMHFEGKK